jgi:hypothetical protein
MENEKYPIKEEWEVYYNTLEAGKKYKEYCKFYKS